MRNGFRVTALAAGLLAGTPLIAKAQLSTVAPGIGGRAAPTRLGPGSVTTSGSGTTVFHGAAGSAAEVPGYGSSAGVTPGYTTGAGGTTIFHSTPGGTSPGSVGASGSPGP